MKNILLSILIAGTLVAGTYDDPYSIVSANTEDAKPDQFMDGDFAEIKRFNALECTSEGMSQDSKEILKTIAETAKNYVENNKTIKIKIIGHSMERTDIDNKVSFNSKEEEKSLEKSKKFAQKIADKLENDNIAKELLFVEYRASKDIGYTRATSEGKELSNRVMVTVYTLPGAKKEVEGDEDKDGVFDSKDECPKTPLGVKVDNIGCPFDTDKDGVLDFKDECPNTPTGLKVNEVGCPVSTTLRLNFAVDSSKIISSSMQKVLDFAEFLKESPAYKADIIGHTDNTASEAYNMKLSVSRAKAVYDALIAEGISADRLRTSGEGELKPIESNLTEEGRASNRRIEVKLYN